MANEFNLMLQRELYHFQRAQDIRLAFVFIYLFIYLFVYLFIHLCFSLSLFILHYNFHKITVISIHFLIGKKKVLPLAGFPVCVLNSSGLKTEHGESRGILWGLCT